MATDRKLIDYLPNYMQDYEELSAIMNADQPVVDDLWNAIEDALKNQFIMDSTEYGVHRWESILGVIPKATDTLDDRKFRIIALINQQLPYTMRRLEQVLAQLCGEDGYSVNLVANDYHIEIGLELGNHSYVIDVERILNAMIPANLVHTITLKFNQHETLKRFTHAELGTMTHEYIRSEVLP